MASEPFVRKMRRHTGHGGSACWASNERRGRYIRPRWEAAYDEGESGVLSPGQGGCAVSDNCGTHGHLASPGAGDMEG